MTEELKCTKCGLHRTARTNKIDSVIPKGNIEIAFVAEAPGEIEEEQGIPLVGPAGMNFNKALEEANISRESVFVGNIARCRPPKNRAPSKVEMDKCFPYLLEELKEAEPKIVVCLGLTAAKTILKNKALKMGEIHGRKYNGRPLLGFECLIIPTWHPSPTTMSNNPHRMGQMIQDIRSAKTMIEHGGELKKEKDWTSFTVDNYATWAKIFPLFLKSKYFIFDLETTGLEFMAKDARITNIGLTSNSDFGVSVVCDSDTWIEADGSNGFDTFLADLHWMMENLKAVAHYMSFDAKYMKKQWGIWPKIWGWDTSLAHSVLKPGDSTRLKDITWQYTDMGGYEYDLAQYGGLMKANAYERAEYNIDDVVSTCRIAEKQMKTIHEQNRNFLMNEIVLPAADVMAEMEYVGVKIDTYKLAELHKVYAKKIKDLKNQMYTHGTIMQFNRSHQPFNPNSSAQLGIILFDKEYCGYTPIKTSPKTGRPSCDKFVLKELKKLHGSEICEMVLEHSAVSKLFSTYIKGMKERIINGRVHTTYHQDVAISGRTSSSKPNLQNIPKESDIKAMFVADPGYRFVDLDYKQMELVVSAYYTDDPIMKEAIASGDAHEYIAKLIFGLTDVGEENRRFIKTLNFGVLYGMGSGKLADRLEIDVEEAKRLINEYFKLMQNTRVWIDGRRRQAEDKGFVMSKMGRVRYYKPKRDLVKGEKEEYNSAVNHPIQSLASDLVMYGISQWKKYLVKQGLYFNGAYMALQVHDSITSCIKEELVDKLIIEMRQVFEATKFPFMTLPLTVDVQTGYDWGNMQKINFTDNTPARKIMI